MKTTYRVLSIFVVLALLDACAPVPPALPTATLTPPPTSTPTPTPTVTPTATPTLVPTAAWPEISETMQSYLDGFDGYDIVEVNGVQTVTVSYHGEAYQVYEELDGAWVRSYADMSKFVHADGSFGMEAEKVFSFGVEESVDDQGRRVIRINQADYDAYKAAINKIYETMDKSQLGVMNPEGTRVGSHDTLAGEMELLLNFTEAIPPRLIGLSGSGDFRLAALGTDEGVVMMMYFGGEGLGYTFGSGSGNEDSVEQVMVRIANGNESVGQVFFHCLMTSESVNPKPYYILGNPEMEKRLRAAARGYGKSFEEFMDLAGNPFSWDRRKVLRMLSDWDQPVTVYEANFRNEEGK